jgi:hypothetical protein
MTYDDPPRPDVGVLIPSLPKVYLWASVGQCRDLPAARFAGCVSVSAAVSSTRNVPGPRTGTEIRKPDEYIMQIVIGFAIVESAHANVFHFEICVVSIL